MATATTPPTSSAAAPGYDQFVDSRIAKTRTAVKSADVATGVVALIAWALVVLLVAAVADHWIVAGGLDRWERYALWGVGIAGAGLYVATRLGPNLWRSVNPLYAARELERETPELKNSLLNLLQLRGATDSPAIKQALERQAAERLARAGDAPIDHTPLVRAAKLLLALVALVGVYVVASPKDFFASAGRVLAPWSQIAAPSRVRITAVEPGAVTLAQGARLNVTAMVSGLKADELVELVYTSDDRQALGRRVPMTASRGGLQFSGSLPAGSGAASALGLQGSLTYRIEAGDAHTPYYQVEVLTAPTIAPVTVRYEYPPYTGYKAREVEGVGDLRAIEGTRVTLSVEANLPIESAQIDIGADGRPDVRMTAEGAKATGALVLRHDGDGATSTSNYVLRFTSTDGQANNDPPQYQIEVLRDLAPEAAIREPEAESIDVALNQRVRVAIEARDPDYVLKRVRLVGEAEGKQILQQDLLRGDGKGGFKAETEIVPQAIGLRPGDVLHYWVEATDNRTPQPNVSVSERRQLRVIASDNPQKGGDREGQQQDGANGDPQQDQQQGDPNAQGQNGEQQQDGGAGQPNQGQQGEQQQPGESGESGQQGGQSKSQAEEEGQQGENGQPPPGGMTGPGNESGGNSSDQSGDGNEGSSSSKHNDGENSPAGGSQAGEQGNQQQPGDNQSGQNGGQQSSGQQPAGNQQSQQQPGGDLSQGQGQSEQPVARDGSDDGSAFDKMLDWMKQQQGDKASGKPSPSNQNQGGENGEAGEDAQQSDSEQSRDESQTQDGQGRGDESQPGQSKSQQQTGKQQGQSGDESDATGSEDEGVAGEADEKQDVAGESNGRQGERGKEGRGGVDSKQQPRNQPGGEQPERNEQGPGAGEQDRSGQQSQSKSSESGGDKPPGESTDRDAGPREGAEGAGQSQAADRGAGQSADKGAGDASGREGGEEASDSPTGGKSGDERGAGSKSRESQNGEGEQSGAGDKQQGNQQQGGEQQNGQSQEGQQGKPSEGSEGQPGQNVGDNSQQSGDAQQQSDQQNSLDDQRGKGPQDSRSPVGTGGGPMEFSDRGATSDAAGEGAESGGDAANLDYAREQTELVLQRLDEQLRKKEVDRKLLDKLGWTEEDLQDFVNRWQLRQQKAAERGAEGEAELDRALRSLGLNKKGPTAKSNVTEDSFRDLRESARAKIPPRMQEQVESYLRSINAADDAPAADE